MQAIVPLFLVVIQLWSHRQTNRYTSVTRMQASVVLVPTLGMWDRPH